MQNNNSSSIITLFGLGLALYAICNADEIKENYGFGVAQGVVKTDTIYANVPKDGPNGASSVLHSMTGGYTVVDAMNIHDQHSIQDSVKAMVGGLNKDYSGNANEMYVAPQHQSNMMHQQPHQIMQQQPQHVMQQQPQHMMQQRENFEHLQQYNVQQPQHMGRQPMPGVENSRIGEFYEVPGNYSANLNPRFANIDYGANIKYNMPPENMQASPVNPLTFSNMTNEGYNYSNDDSCVPKTVYQGSAPIAPANYAAGNFNKVMESTYKESKLPRGVNDIQRNLPVKDMTALKGEGDNNDNTQPIVYDRYIVANLKSRQSALGDPIRGDIPIVPNDNGWFNTSYQPQKDLNRGALFAMGGLYNEQARDLASLIEASSGGGVTNVGGEDLKQHFDKQNAIKRNLKAKGRNLSHSSSGAYNIDNQFTSKYSSSGDIDVNIGFGA